MQRAADALAAAQAAAQPAGPVLSVHTSRLVLECHHQETCSGVVTVSATGSSAVYYSWSRQSLRPSRATRPSHEACDKPAIYMPELRGAILPGQSKQFRFSFVPQRPGTCTEEWQLQTLPEATQVHGGRRVIVRGVATVHDDRALARRKLQAQLHHSEQQRQVAAALDHVLRSMPEPASAPQPLSATEWAEHNRFASATHHRTPPVYWQPGINGQLQALCSELRAALTPPVDPKKKPKKGEEAPVSLVPEQFDGSISSVLGYINLVRCRRAGRAAACALVLVPWSATGKLWCVSSTTFCIGCTGRRAQCCSCGIPVGAAPQQDT